ncbi:hypothetical protein Tco_0919228 [Tanacetum coccineum]
MILFVIEQPTETQVINCTKINLDNKSVNDTLTADLERYKKQVKILKEGQNVDLKSKDNGPNSCEQSKEESRNIDREIALEKRIKQLDNIVFKRDQSAQTVHMLMKPQFFYDHTTKQALGFQNPFYLKKAQQLEQRPLKLKGKSVIACRESVNKSKVIAPVVHKVYLEPLSPKLKNNREAHVDYIRITKENADTLRDVVEQARTSNPLDNALAYACMYTKQIQELLVYVSDTCPSFLLKSEKLVAVILMNKLEKSLLQRLVQHQTITHKFNFTRLRPLANL